MQAGEIDSIEVSRPGPLPPVSCAGTRGQSHRPGAMDLCGMLDEQSTGVTAMEEDPVRGMRVRVTSLPTLRPGWLGHWLHHE
jgi:hypothetical protein